MKYMMKKSEDEHNERVVSINNQRVNDITAYITEKQKNILNNLISMHNSPQKMVQSWWSMIFGT